MAKVTGNQVELDFDPASEAQGQVVERGADHVRVAFSPTYEAIYHGQFQWSGTEIVGGEITEYDEIDNGAEAVSITGLHMPALSIIKAQDVHDGSAVVAGLFEGDDSVLGSSRDDYIAAGAGSDTVHGGGGDDALQGGDGADLLSGDEGSDSLYGGDGDDTVSGGAGADWHVNGNKGNDSVSGGAGDDRIYGGQGDDWVQGDEGDDTISGDLGNDTLVGGPGTDLMIGGAGADRFVFGGGHDTIADFNGAEGDRIVLARGDLFSVANDDGHAVITIAGGGLIDVLGVSAVHLSDWLIVA